MKIAEFIEAVLLAFDKQIIKKLVLSRPTGSDTVRISARLCAHRGISILALEYALPSNTVRHKNLRREEIEGELTLLLREYRQANLITTLGDVEWRTGKGGRVALLGNEALKRKISGAQPDFELAIQSLDRKKDYLLTGKENFLIELGISDKSGRIHDKRQGKFRQINRFLEIIDDLYPSLPSGRQLLIYDLCCGKSYLSFAVYYYLSAIKDREVKMLGIDLKRDVIVWCDGVARSLGYTGMQFIHGDIKDNTPTDLAPDMVVSLHACDIATDTVIDRAAELGAGIILSTPCCHRYLNDRLTASELSFVTEYPQLRGKLCEAITDALRLMRLSTAGYDVSALELTDPDDTPKNTLLRAVRKRDICDAELKNRKEKYQNTLSFLLGERADEYLKEIK